MVEFFLLDYGYQVLVRNGTKGGKVGHVITGRYERGIAKVAVSFEEKPGYGYDAWVLPSNLELLSRANPHGVRPQHRFEGVSVFREAQMSTAYNTPERVLGSPHEFPPEVVRYARRVMEKQSEALQE